MIQVLMIIALLLTSMHPAWAQLDKVLKGLGGAVGTGSGLSDVKIGSGLQEALKVGTESAVVQTGRVDGFYSTKRLRS